ncbi:MAG: radical SAM protein [Acidobacteriia bacterium]|nr:radical SAM protein [Terriglobia bacterium]
MTGLVTLQPLTFAPPPASPPKFHLLAGEPRLAFLVDGSRLFEIDPTFYGDLASGDPDAGRSLLEVAGIAPIPADPAERLSPPTSLSLNIAQACNLTCSYCYADEGRFGGRAELMSEEVAFAAVDRLLAGARGKSVTVGFIGGEPLLNRPVLHATVAYACDRARERRQPVRFSITTNATLVNASDIELFRRHAFGISVSLDGSEAVNDANRRAHDGTSAWAAAVERLTPLLDDPGGVKLAARSTVTHANLRILERIDALSAVGFAEIGVAPVRTSPMPGLALRENDWPRLLAEFVRAGDAEFGRVSQGLPLRFSNLATALKQIHHGSARRLPCGAGANYLSVSTSGEYFACHRTIGDARFRMGASESDGARERFLSARDVDRQPLCSSCWARYLCGGGCHAEVVASGRSGCDYIRGWLEYCLRFYDRLIRIHPDFFEHPAQSMVATL